MSRNIYCTLLMSIIVSSASGCSHAPLSKNFGRANTSNIAVQTVNPGAGRGDAGVTTLDGQKSEKVLQRYRSDTGKAPKEVLVNNVNK